MIGKIRKRMKFQHRLTPKEKEEYGRALSVANLELKGVEEEKKAANKEFKDQMDALRAAIDATSIAIRDGYEWREDMCFGVPGDDGLISFVASSGEVVEIRRMTDLERQQVLFPDDGDEESDEGDQVVSSLWTPDKAYRANQPPDNDEDGGEAAH